MCILSVKPRAAVPTPCTEPRTDKMTKPESNKRWGIKCIIMTSVIVMCSLTILITAAVYTSHLVTKRKGTHNLYNI